jgi:hypothetical protein
MPLYRYRLVLMKRLSVFVTLVGALFLSFTATQAAEAARKLTCCQEAKAKDKECAHKCCIAAHKKGESCTRCNPNKEDLAKKDGKKTDKSTRQ